MSCSGCLEQMHALHSQNPSHPQLKTHRASLLRSLFSVGVVCKFFDVDSFTQKSVSVRYQEYMRGGKMGVVHYIALCKHFFKTIEVKLAKVMVACITYGNVSGMCKRGE